MSNIPYLLILSLWLWAIDSSLAQQRDKFSAAEVKADLQHLYQTLEASHYDLYVNTPQKTFQKEYKRLQQAVKDSLTLLEINRLFQPFVALSKVGHCNAGYPFKSYNAFLAGRGRVFPFEVLIEDRKVYVLENYTKDSSIRKGDEITALYGVKMSHWLDGIYRYLSGENERYKNTLIDLIGFPRLYWMVFGESKLFSFTIKQADGHQVILSEEGLLASDYKEIRSKRPSVFNSNRELKFLNQAAYLRPGAFVNQASSGNTSTVKTFEKGEFFQFIDSCFIEIKKQQAKHLIVDLRGNPGGDNSFSDYLVAFFAKKPFAFTSSFHVKTSPVTREYWKNVSDTTLADLKKNILTRKDGERFKVDIRQQAPRTDSLRFEGKVYVLVDRYSYSNAVTTAAMIQDYHFGVLIGEQTADAPTLLGAVHEFELPHTKISITYPKAFMIRPNGDKSLIGVMPNYPVENNRFTPQDQILEWTLEHIRKN